MLYCLMHKYNVNHSWSCKSFVGEGKELCLVLIFVGLENKCVPYSITSTERDQIYFYYCLTILFTVVLSCTCIIMFLLESFYSKWNC